MLALLSHVLNRRSIDVLSGRHRRNLDPSVSYTLCGDKLLIQLGLGGTLLHDLDDRLFLSESANDVEVLGLDHVILLSLQEMLGLLLLQVHLLLEVETRGKSTRIGRGHRAICVLSQLPRGLGLFCSLELSN